MTLLQKGEFQRGAAENAEEFRREICFCPHSSVFIFDSKDFLQWSHKCIRWYSRQPFGRLRNRQITANDRIARNRWRAGDAYGYPRTAATNQSFASSQHSRSYANAEQLTHTTRCPFDRLRRCPEFAEGSILLPYSIKILSSCHPERVAEFIDASRCQTVRFLI